MNTSNLTGGTQVTMPSAREVRVTRLFHAPRRLVWDAHTQPALLKRWLFGPEGWSLDVCEVDLRAGGKARYEMSKNDGAHTMGWSDTYQEIVPQQRIVSTQLFDEDWTQGETTVTLLFRELGPQKTELELTVLYSSKEARDAALGTGMTVGMEMGYARVDALLEELQAANNP
jgi:uncharacterized protein YndB with AHSA1/START domain